LANNQKQHSYAGLKTLSGILLAGVTGPLGWVLGLGLTYLFNWMAKKGAYVINVQHSNLVTNMDRKTWEQISTGAWALKDQEDAGLIQISDEERRKGSGAFRTAFRRFAVYGKVQQPR